MPLTSVLLCCVNMRQKGLIVVVFVFSVCVVVLGCVLHSRWLLQVKNDPLKRFSKCTSRQTLRAHWRGERSVGAVIVQNGTERGFARCFVDGVEGRLKEWRNFNFHPREHMVEKLHIVAVVCDLSHDAVVTTAELPEIFSYRRILVLQNSKDICISVPINIPEIRSARRKCALCHPTLRVSDNLNVRWLTHFMDSYEHVDRFYFYADNATTLQSVLGNQSRLQIEDMSYLKPLFPKLHYFAQEYAMHDCLYLASSAKYKWVIFADNDEILKFHRWAPFHNLGDLMLTLEKNGAVGASFGSVDYSTAHCVPEKGNLDIFERMVYRRVKPASHMYNESHFLCTERNTCSGWQGLRKYMVQASNATFLQIHSGSESYDADSDMSRRTVTLNAAFVWLAHYRFPSSVTVLQEHQFCQFSFMCDALCPVTPSISGEDVFIISSRNAIREDAHGGHVRMTCCPKNVRAGSERIGLFNSQKIFDMGQFLSVPFVPPFFKRQARFMWASGFNVFQKPPKEKNDLIWTWTLETEQRFQEIYDDVMRPSSVGQSCTRNKVKVMHKAIWGVCSRLRDLSDVLLTGLFEGRPVVHPTTQDCSLSPHYDSFMSTLLQPFSTCQGFLSLRDTPGQVTFPMGLDTNDVKLEYQNSEWTNCNINGGVSKAVYVTNNLNLFRKLAMPIWLDLRKSGLRPVLDESLSPWESGALGKATPAQILGVFRSLLSNIVMRVTANVEEFVTDVKNQIRPERCKNMLVIHVRRGDTCTEGSLPPHYCIDDVNESMAVIRRLVSKANWRMNNDFDCLFYITGDNRFKLSEVEHMLLPSFIGKPILLTTQDKWWGPDAELIAEILVAARYGTFLIGSGHSGISQLIAQLMGARYRVDPNALTLWEDDPEDAEPLDVVTAQEDEPQAEILWMDEPEAEVLGASEGMCPSCEMVPCGECQEDCSPSPCGDKSRNGCANNNKGFRPSHCMDVLTMMRVRRESNQPKKKRRHKGAAVHKVDMGSNTCERCPLGQCDPHGWDASKPCLVFDNNLIHCRLQDDEECPSGHSCWFHVGARYYSMRVPAPCHWSR